MQYAMCVRQTKIVLIYFGSLFEMIEKAECENRIIGGDLNLALDIDKDKRGIVYNNDSAAEALKDKMLDYTLIDTWRINMRKVPIYVEKAWSLCPVRLHTYPNRVSFMYRANRNFAWLS